MPMLRRRPLISLCMIVKDEAANLARCLESVRGVADEIVVVDTGSTDATVEVAQGYGARIVREPWGGDFAAARNAGVRVARGEWILFLDGDEALDAGQGGLLRQLAELREDEGLFLEIRNYVGDGSHGATVNPVLRMFRNRPEHRFEGRIHEQIAASILARTPGASFRLTDVVIHHYGYQQAFVVEKNKVERNMKLLEAALADEPDNPFYLYNLGVEYLRTGRPEPALALFRACADRIDPLAVSYAHLASKYEIRCLQALGRWDEAVRRTDEALPLYPDYTDLHQYRAASMIALGREADAANALLEALKRGRAPSPYHTEEGIGTFRTAYMLGELLERIGEVDEALRWYRESIRLRSSLTPPLYRSFRLLRIAGREQDIVPWIEDGFLPNSPEAWAKLAAVLSECRCYGPAIELMRRCGMPAEARLVAEAEEALADGRLDDARAKLETMGAVRSDAEATAFAEQLRWLSDGEGPWRDALAAALAEERRETDGRLADEDWRALRRLLEGSAACGRTDRYGRVLSYWQEALGSVEASAATGARMLVLGLSETADRHLALAFHGETEDGRRDLIAQARLRLPMEQGE
ncbi:glycosyltransferase [Cohnella sp. GCM10027633]|uniref:glycosyltransferase n=1 Tax=unclassified Cohnella TaxID=2636738 RepID=UPI00363656A2